MYLITGGGSGIGQALAWALADRNKAVLIVGRREQALRETAEHRPTIRYCVADVAQAVGRQKLLSELQHCTALDALVNNAGIIEPIAPLAEIGEAEWQRLMATNVDAPLFLTQALLPKLRQGRVLQMGSGAAYFPVVGWGAYCSSKAALSIITRVWQAECPDMAIASVMPGIIDTAMQATIRHSGAMATDKQAFFTDLKEKGQLLDCDTVAAFLCWLLLDTPLERFRSQEWDIYDREHHRHWLVPPHRLVHWEE
ncbi:MAG: SDR family NAD(P)-dependent oxidoreductase [Legionellaceae bacterium]|nr:SDR family NAD(P)-dependent oxidoreductase [Legionellaceae bacterium]